MQSTRTHSNPVAVTASHETTVRRRPEAADWPIPKQAHQSQVTTPAARLAGVQRATAAPKR
jgi:hypothetical protein